MEENVKDLLNEAIATEIRALSDLPAGSAEKSDAVDNVAKLYKLRIDENKSEWDADEKYSRREMEEKQFSTEMTCKAEQMSESVMDRYFRTGVAAAEIILPLIFYGVWMGRGFKFEQTGAYTSTTFRNLFNRFKPTKR